MANANAICNLGPYGPNSPSNPNSPADPLNPMNPANPNNPSNPMNPLNPASPMNPMNPANPEPHLTLGGIRAGLRLQFLPALNLATIARKSSVCMDWFSADSA